MISSKAMLLGRQRSTNFTRNSFSRTSVSRCTFHSQRAVRVAPAVIRIRSASGIGRFPKGMPRTIWRMNRHQTGTAMAANNSSTQGWRNTGLRGSASCDSAPLRHSLTDLVRQGQRAAAVYSYLTCARGGLGNLHPNLTPHRRCLCNQTAITIQVTRTPSKTRQSTTRCR